MIVIDDVLCCIQSVRDSLNEVCIVQMAVGYYTPEIVLVSKESIFKVCEEEYTKRRQSKQYLNPSTRDVEDIIDLMVKMEGKEMPQYVSRGYGTMSSNEFEKIAGIMCSMRDEVCSLRVELKETRKEREKDDKILEDNILIKQEIIDIKMMMKSLCETKSLITKKGKTKMKNQLLEKTRKKYNQYKN